MVLAMARPFKHPKTGMYWLRRRVPVDLITIVGKSEVLVSLRTKDASEAKERHLVAMAEVEKRWTNLRAGPIDLSEREALEIARELYDRWIELYRDEPSRQTRWRTALFELLWQPPVISETSLSLGSIDPTVLPLQEMRELAFEGADTLLQRRGLQTDKAGRAKLARAVGVVVQHASLELVNSATGCDVLPNSFAKSPLTATPITATTKPALSFSFDEAIKLWIAEKQPRERTIYEWRRIFKELAGFVGHSDAARLTIEDLLRWKNAMLEAKRSPKTIRDAKIAPVRAILQVSVENRKLITNPAEKITMTVKRAVAGARRDFTETEAIIILKAAMLEKSPTLRWVPWICAYSGARLSEACQLRREDVHQHEGIWIMRFAAEAGPLKNAGSERALLFILL